MDNNIEINEKSDDHLKDYYKYLHKEKEKFANAFDFYKENCIVRFDEIEDLEIMDFEDGEYYHIGYCTVTKCEYKNGQKPKREIFEVKDCESDLKENLEDLLFEKQWEADGFYILLFQREGYCGDDCSGYVLYPMKDDRYWIVKFSI